MKNKKWFSFVELIVSVTILAVISTIWFISYSWYLWDSRDSQRKSDLAQLWSALKVYKQKRWYYANPGDSFEILYHWSWIISQWKFNDKVRLNTLDRLPLDPKTKGPYLYSIVKNKQQFEIAATLENEDSPIAIVHWTYKSVARATLPWIILAIERESTQTATIEAGEIDSQWDNWIDTRNKFIFTNQDHNLPYDFVDNAPTSDGTSVEAILTELETSNSYWQNTDYRNCIEIKESGKAIQSDWTPMTYQIITDAWTLVDIDCTF